MIGKENLLYKLTTILYLDNMYCHGNTEFCRISADRTMGLHNQSCMNNDLNYSVCCVHHNLECHKHLSHIVHQSNQEDNHISLEKMVY